MVLRCLVPFVNSLLIVELDDSFFVVVRIPYYARVEGLWLPSSGIVRSLVWGL
jgi:hypothetical protein